MADDYYPLELGQVREYLSKSTRGQFRIEIETIEVDHPSLPSRGKIRSVFHGAKKETSEYVVRREDEGVYEGEELQIGFPLKLGTTWFVDPREFTIAALDEVVTSKAGIFVNCLRVDYLIGGGAGGGGSHFYAPGVGLVKREVKEEIDTFDWELISVRSK